MIISGTTVAFILFLVSLETFKASLCIVMIEGQWRFSVNEQLLKSYHKIALNRLIPPKHHTESVLAFRLKQQIQNFNNL